MREPAPTIHESAPTRGILLDGARIAEEFGRTPGWFLFHTHRTVELWARTPPQHRRELVSSDAHAERLAALTTLRLAIARPLRVLTDLLRHPARADAARVVAACREVAAWASCEGARETALLFAEAAILVRPGSAGLLCEAGMMAAAARRWPVAEKWLTLAAEAGRKTRQWGWAAWALHELGRSFRQRGDAARARTYLDQALQLAQAHAEPVAEAYTLHELTLLEMTCGNAAEADARALQAVRVYPVLQEGLVSLARAMAEAWVDQGSPTHALSLSTALLPHVHAPHERVELLATVARAAAEAAHAAAHGPAPGAATFPQRPEVLRAFLARLEARARELPARAHRRGPAV